MAKVTFIYEGGQEEGDFPQTSLLTQEGIEDLDSLSSFLASALRGAGYTYVDRVGWADSKGAVTWGPF